jgi:hypothetical protein
MKHTKAPWKLGGDYGFELTIIADNGKRICEVKAFPTPDFNDTSQDEATLNAKLIAAAPDLLENLVRMIDRIEESNYQNDFPSAYTRAKAAIKKATL